MRRARGPALLALALALAACSDERGTADDRRDPGGAVPPPPVPHERALSAGVARCAGCHAEVVQRYAGSHGMADSLGAVGELSPATVTDPVTGATYELTPGEQGGVLAGTTAGGGRREQQVVGRIGAGLLDVSLVAAERHAGQVGGRLSFAPLEFVTGHGWTLSPFVAFGSDAGLDQPVTSDCLGCHTDTDVATLPGAASSGSTVYPRNHLGAEALRHLEPLGCEACHGGTAQHVARMEALAPGAPAPVGEEQLGLRGWRDLPVQRQRESCARCHLEGEVRVALAGESSGRLLDGLPLLGRRPVLVTAAPDEDFRFVGQVERLALSRCFSESPEMTCVTCHDPHAGVAAQGLPSLERACLRCHDGGAGCVRPDGLAVADVTGGPARTGDGCVDCHVRRSQPYDLGHVRTADHFVRRRIERPASPAPRPFHDARGGLALFRDEALDEALAQPGGARWEDGVIALGLLKQGRHAEAAARLADFPAPGSAEARQSTAPPGLAALETSPAFHGLRGHLLEALGMPQQALAAYGDALALDPSDPEALLNRASLAVTLGDLQGALADTGALLELHPLSDKAWNVNARAASKAGDLPAALAALAQSAERWPVAAAVHHEAGRLLLRMGDHERARLALQRAAELEPGRAGLAEDLRAAGG